MRVRRFHKETSNDDQFVNACAPTSVCSIVAFLAESVIDPLELFVVNRSLLRYGFVLLAAALASACSGTSAAPARGRGGEGGPVPVVVAQATQRDVPVDIDAIGNVEAYSTISVRAQVTGQLTEVRFHEGDFVRKNEHLFTIDPRPFQAQLDQAQANLKRDQALLDQAEAQLTR